MSSVTGPMKLTDLTELLFNPDIQNPATPLSSVNFSEDIDFSEPLTTEHCTTLFEQLHSTDTLKQSVAANILILTVFKHKDDIVIEKLFVLLPQLIFNAKFSELKSWGLFIERVLLIEKSSMINLKAGPEFLSTWLIILQNSKLASAHRAFQQLITEYIHTHATQVFTAARAFNADALVIFLKILKTNDICHKEFLSFLWNNYSNATPRIYSGILIDWTLIHKRIPNAIVEHLGTLESLSLPPRLMKNLYSDLWIQRDKWEEDTRRSFNSQYIIRLSRLDKLAEERIALQAEKKFLTPEDSDLLFNITHSPSKPFVKEASPQPVKKGIHWLPPLTQQFHSALDIGDYELAISSLAELKKLLRSGDKRLHLPKFVLVLLPQLSNEPNIQKRNSALQEFDKLWTREKDVSIWMARPPLFIQGAKLYLQMTNVDPNCALIGRLLTIQKKEFYSAIKTLLPSLLEYLVRQIDWNKELLVPLLGWFDFNAVLIKFYLSMKTLPPEFHFAFILHSIPHRQLDALVSISLTKISTKETILQNYQKIFNLLSAYFLESNLDNTLSNCSEPVTHFLTILSESSDTYPYAKPFLKTLIDNKDNVLQTNPKWAEGCEGIVDSLIQWDLDLAVDYLKKINKANLKGLSEKFNKFFTAVLKNKNLSEALKICTDFNQYLKESELIPAITENDVVNPSKEVIDLLIKYRSQLKPAIWLRFCIHRYLNDKMDIVQEYDQQAIDAIKKISSQPEDTKTFLDDETVNTHFYKFLLALSKFKLTKQQHKDLSSPSLQLTLDHYDPLNVEQTQIIGNFQRSVLSGNSHEELANFRKKVAGLSAFNTFQEVAQINSLPSAEDVDTLFFRAEVLTGFIKPKAGAPIFVVYPPLGILIEKLVTKNFTEPTRYLKLLEKVLTFNKDEFALIHLDNILLNILHSEALPVQASFKSWLLIFHQQNGAQTLPKLVGILEKYVKEVSLKKFSFNATVEQINSDFFSNQEKQTLFLKLLAFALDKIPNGSIELTNEIELFYPSLSYAEFTRSLFDDLSINFSFIQDTKEFKQIMHRMFSYISCMALQDGSEKYFASYEPLLNKFLLRLRVSLLHIDLKFSLYHLFVGRFTHYAESQIYIPTNKHEAFTITHINHLFGFSIPASIEYIKHSLELLWMIEMTSSYSNIQSCATHHKVSLLAMCGNLDISGFRRNIEIKAIDTIRFLSLEVLEYINKENFEYDLDLYLTLLKMSLISKRREISDKEHFKDYFLLVKQLMSHLLLPPVLSSGTEFLIGMNQIKVIYMSYHSIKESINAHTVPDVDIMELHYSAYSSFLRRIIIRCTVPENLPDQVKFILTMLEVVLNLLDTLGEENCKPLLESFIEQDLLSLTVSYAYVMLGCMKNDDLHEENPLILMIESFFNKIKTSAFLKTLFQPKWNSFDIQMEDFFQKQFARSLPKYDTKLHSLRKLYIECFMMG